MKNKIVTVALGVLLVASIGLNVWQYMNNSSLMVQSDNLQTEIGNLNENINSLDNDISTKNEEISTLSEKIVELENSVQTLQADNDSLSIQLEELETTKEEVTVSDENAGGPLITDDMVSAFVDMLMEENPPSTPGHIDVDVQGTHEDTHDGGEYYHGIGGEVPDDLKGDFIN